MQAKVKPAPSSTLKLSGTLASGQTFVVTRKDANQAIKDAAQASGLIDSSKSSLILMVTIKLFLKKECSC